MPDSDFSTWISTQSIAEKISLIINNQTTDEIIYFEWLFNIKNSLTPTILTKHIDKTAPIRGSIVKQNPIKNDTIMNCKTICG